MEIPPKMVQSSSPFLVAHAPPTLRSETIQARLCSLDAFRGATMALMVLVNTPGGPNSYGPLNHSAWGMSEQDLNGAEIHAGFQQMGGEGVPQQVRMNGLGDAG